MLLDDLACSRQRVCCAGTDHNVRRVRSDLAVDKFGSSGWQIMFFITGLQNLIGVTVWHFWQSSTIVPEINNPAAREQF